MRLSARGIALIKKFEGFSSEIYRCAAGYHTIGYGHVVRAGERFESIDRAMAEQLLMDDARRAEMAVARLVTIPLTQDQFDALVSFTFNLGAGQLQMSTLRRMVNRGEHDAVPAQFMRWVYAGGKRLAGLAQRRQLESLLYQGIQVI